MFKRVADHRMFARSFGVKRKDIAPPDVMLCSLPPLELSCAARVLGRKLLKHTEMGITYAPGNPAALCNATRSFAEEWLRLFEPPSGAASVSKKKMLTGEPSRMGVSKMESLRIWTSSSAGRSAERIDHQVLRR